MKRVILFLLFIPETAFSFSLKTVYNPFTGKMDYIWNVMNDSSTWPAAQEFSSMTVRGNFAVRNGSVSVQNPYGVVVGTMFIVQAGNGNVGIGTISPEARLHVMGGSTIFGATSGGTYNANICIPLNDRYGYWQMRSGGTTKSQLITDVNSGGIYYDFLGNFYFRNQIDGGTILMTLLNAGNVGILTATPGVKFDVGDGTTEGNIYHRSNSPLANEAGYLIAKAGSNKWFIYSPGGSTDLRFWDTTDRVTFQTGGNVGIGTTGPATKLELGIGTLANGGYDGIKITEANSNLYLLERKSAGAAYYSSLFNDASQPLVLQEAGGNVGIGTTNPSSARLQIVALAGGLTHERTVNGYFLAEGFDGTNAYITYYTTGRLVLGYGETTGLKPSVNTLTLMKGGDVGIGTINPAYKLDVAGVVQSTGVHIGTSAIGTSMTGALVIGTGTSSAYFHITDTEGVRNAAAIKYSTGTTTRFSIDATSMTHYGSVYAGRGDSSYPAYSFVGDPDTGLYSEGANYVNIGVGGSKVILFSGTVITLSQKIQAQYGTQAAPSFGFLGGGSGSGMYYDNTNSALCLVSGGITVNVVDSSVTVTGGKSGIALSTISFTNPSDGIIREQTRAGLELLTSTVPDNSISTMSVTFSTRAYLYIVINTTPGSAFGGDTLVTFNNGANVMSPVYSVRRSSTPSAGTFGVSTSSLGAVGIPIFGDCLASSNSARTISLTTFNNQITRSKAGMYDAVAIDTATNLPLMTEGVFAWDMNGAGSAQQISNVTVSWVQGEPARPIPYSGKIVHATGSSIHVYGRKD